MECPICLEHKDDFYPCDICKESICKDCKKAWKKDCPYCRARYIAIPVVSVADIEQVLPSQPLLLNYLHEPVVEQRFELRQIIGCALFGGLIAWCVFQ